MLALQGGFVALYLLGRVVPTTSTITLSRLQSVTGYSEACTDAYNTPLTACTALDLAPGHPCSKGCINFLDDLTTTIHQACRGSKAYPDTLMGMFFISEGTTAVCPNARGPTGSDSADGIEVQPTFTVTSPFDPSDIPKSLRDSSASIPRTTTSALTTISTVVVPTFFTPSSSPSQPDAPSAPSTTSVTPPDSATVSGEATSVTTIPLSVLTAAPTSTEVTAQTTEKTPKLKATSGGGAGGGTPFDITSSSHREVSPGTLRVLTMLVLAIPAWWI